MTTPGIQSVLIADEVWDDYKRSFEKDHPALELRSMGDGYWSIAMRGGMTDSTTSMERCRDRSWM